MYILDTNIVVYYFQGNRAIIDLLDDLNQERFYLSVISRLEVLIGHSRENLPLSEIQICLDDLCNLPVDTAIVDEALSLQLQGVKKLKFKDLLIAATAKIHNKTLLTADKDFKGIPGVKVKLVKV